MVLGWTTVMENATLPRDFKSEWRAMRDERSGATLEFSVEIVRGGVFHVLRGRTPGYAWPRRWSVSEHELGRVMPVRLPSFVEGKPCLRVLQPLVGDAPQIAPRLMVGCTDAADPAALEQLERDQEARLPESYRRFLLATDGLLVGDDVLGGTADVYVVVLDDDRWWVIASMYGTESVVLPGDGRDGPVLLWPHDARQSHQAHELARDFETFLSDSLARGRLTG